VTSSLEVNLADVKRCDATSKPIGERNLDLGERSRRHILDTGDRRALKPMTSL
jgi:hypothetical protein